MQIFIIRNLNIKLVKSFPNAGIYELGKASLHNHTKKSFGDGRISPENLVEAAFGEYGFQIVAITDHHTTAGFPKAFERTQELAEKLSAPLVCVKGVEVSCSIGEIPCIQRFSGIFLPRVVHLLALCLPTDICEADRIPSLKGIEYVSRWARGLKAVVGVAHPAPTATIDRLSYKETEILVDNGLVDFIEVTDPSGVSKEMVQLAQEAGIPGIATPDTHRTVRVLPYIYTIFTDSSSPIRSQEDVSDYIRRNGPMKIYRSDEIPPEYQRRRGIHSLLP